ncbi:MAG TPA: hypothetical protein P5555_14100 [Candidatus Paceibacterota bacterium]|nr:hypothetical protein [Verrucomicrobiota bacterium]HRZ46317.1 hypothetical protein [Candidatus Paceibacterota bacterium]
MLTVNDIQPHIEKEFGLRLEPLGFQRLAQRRWVRSQKQPIRELFEIATLKGGRYSPAWGFSSGTVPSFRGQTFRRQSTDKNAIMDLVIDPIDITGDVPSQTFRFITGCDTQIPTGQICACAEHFVPLALADFDRVHSLHDFCRFFLERSQLQYRRFLFHNYVQHNLVFGFVLILMGRRDDGLARIKEFCRSRDVDFDDRVLAECIRYASGGLKTD